MFSSCTVSGVSSEAAMAGSAAFFAPLISTRPDRGAPPTTRILSIAFPGNYTTGQTLQILQNRFDRESGGSQHPPQRLKTRRVDFDEQMPARAQAQSSLRKEAGVDVGPRFAAEERQMRFVVDDCPIQPAGVRTGNVRKITEDEIEGRHDAEGFEEITTDEVDAPIGPVPDDVLPRYGERGRTYVDGKPARIRDLPGKRDRD